MGVENPEEYISNSAKDYGGAIGLVESELLHWKCTEKFILVANENERKGMYAWSGVDFYFWYETISLKDSFVFPGLELSSFIIWLPFTSIKKGYISLTLNIL